MGSKTEAEHASQLPNPKWDLLSSLLEKFTKAVLESGGSQLQCYVFQGHRENRAGPRAPGLLAHVVPHRPQVGLRLHRQQRLALGPPHW